VTGKRLSALRVQARARAALIDAAAAVLLSAFAVATWPVTASAATAAALASGLAATTSVGWRRRAPASAVVVAGAGLTGSAWLTHSTAVLAEALALLLVIYTAGARPTSRRQASQLAALAGYGIAVCILVDAVAGPVSVSVVATHALPIVIAPAVAGILVARQRALSNRLAAATERLRAGEQARLAVIRMRERNRVARDLHDVVAHGVSVMVVQAGAARITLTGETEVSRAALAEVMAAGRTGLSELSRILGVIGIEDPDRTGPPFGVTGIMTLADRRQAGGLPVVVTVTGSNSGLPAPVDETLYRLVQEALTNVIKHARSAPAEVNVAIEPDAVRVWVRNSRPSAAVATASVAVEVATAGRGHGLTGMRERVESCGGQLDYGRQPDGGFEVRARLPLSPADGDGSGSPGPGSGRPLRAEGGRWPGRLPGWLRPIGPWALGLALIADAAFDADRRGPLALNVALAAGMSVALLGRRRAPLSFLIAINLLALPVSNGLASISNPTLVSTFVFVVPVWTVAAWCATSTAVIGLVLTAAFDTAEGIYWHLGAASILPNVLLTVALWIVGRVVYAQRLIAADLERTRSSLEAGQQARETLALTAERTEVVAQLHARVASEVSGMVATAAKARDLVGTDAAAAAVLAGEIERDGRQALAQLREILGMLRSDYDPAPLSPGLGLAHIRDLVSRSAREETSPQATLAVVGVPVPLPEGVDVVAYRVVAEILTAGACTVVEAGFGQHHLTLDFALTRPGGVLGSAVLDDIGRVGGTVRAQASATGEQVTVHLPLGLVPTRP
jgi:signal transduction histidine kinase